MTDAEIRRYLDKSGDTEIQTGERYEEPGSFLVWRVVGDSLVILQMFGDGRKMVAKAQAFGRILGCKRLKFATRRNPSAIARRHGFHVTGYVMEREI